MTQKFNKLKSIKAIFIFIFLGTIISCVSSQSQSNPEAEPNIEMHRVQDSTFHESGWYYANSTKGNFSVLMPIVFNDFTVTVNGYETYNIGSVSDEGIKLTVSQAKNLKDTPIDLKKIVANLDSPPKPISEIKYYSLYNYSAVNFFQKSVESAAFCKYANHNNYLYTMIIEFPYDQEGLVREIKDSFFDYLIIED